MIEENYHPIYFEFKDSWNQILDCYLGERIIKKERTKYLPATSSMIEDKMGSINSPGTKAYNAYLARAIFPDLIKPTVKEMVGLIHTKPPKISLPEKLKPLLKSCTSQKESLFSVLRKIHEYQVLYGRCGIFVDIPNNQGPNALPYLSIYSPLSIVNWSENNDFVLLKEDSYNLNGFKWEPYTNYRLCVLDENKNYFVQNFSQDKNNEKFEISFNKDFSVSPSLAGNNFDSIPFVFVNTNDLATQPSDIPLMGLSDLALAIYRLEADHRQSLFLQGQATLVVSGVFKNDEKSYRIGAGQVLEIDSNDGKAYYVSAPSEGLKHMKATIDSDKAFAESLKSKLIDEKSNQQSGEALKVRMASKTASLKNIALTGIEALKVALKHCAKITGENEDDINITMDLDFTKSDNVPDQILKLTQASLSGAPISKESIHQILLKNDLTQYTYEEELEKIDEQF